MGRAPCCDKANVKKGPWSPEEDAQLRDYIDKHGTGGNWISLPQKAGLKRCGKSCRLRWLNYLRPNIKHGDFTGDEDRLIYNLFATIGSRWSIISSQLPGRTDNDIKNYWNTKLKKKLMTHSSQRKTPQSSSSAYHHASIPVLDLSSSSTITKSSPYSDQSTRSYSSSDSNYCSITPASSWSFTGYDHQTTGLSIPSSILNGSTTFYSNILGASDSSVQTRQECYNSHDSISNNYQLHQDSSFFKNFGAGPVSSCSTSSDGSTSTNQIIYDKELEVRDYGEHISLQSYHSNGFNEISHDSTIEKKPNGSYTNGDRSPLGDHYSTLEEIKQLINTNNCNNFFVDENNTEGKARYY